MDQAIVLTCTIQKQVSCVDFWEDIDFARSYCCATLRGEPPHFVKKATMKFPLFLRRPSQAQPSNAGKHRLFSGQFLLQLGSGKVRLLEVSGFRTAEWRSVAQEV